MDPNREDQELGKIERLEEKAERQEEALHETMAELHREVEELRAEREHGPHPFEIKVNNKPVAITGHEHTGLEIKQAAIAVGINIQLDFVLSEELSHDRSRIVGDEQRIAVKAGACFEAIPNDDHS